MHASVVSSHQDFQRFNFEQLDYGFLAKQEITNVFQQAEEFGLLHFVERAYQEVHRSNMSKAFKFFPRLGVIPSNYVAIPLPQTSADTTPAWVGLCLDSERRGKILKDPRLGFREPELNKILTDEHGPSMTYLPTIALPQLTQRLQSTNRQFLERIALPVVRATVGDEPDIIQAHFFRLLLGEKEELSVAIQRNSSIGMLDAYCDILCFAYDILNYLEVYNANSCDATQAQRRTG